MEAVPEKLNILNVSSLGKFALVYDEGNDVYEVKLVNEQLEFTKIYKSGEDRYV